VVFNNGGIYRGTDVNPTGGPDVATTVFVKNARYDKMMEAFGGKGILVNDPADLKAALDEAMAFDGPALVNVILDPKAGRKPQEHAWHT
ncbi:MAG: oxalyl-CoA decarboxylase, partial [Alphaproteobacteria bacterium]